MFKLYNNPSLKILDNNALNLMIMEFHRNLRNSKNQTDQLNLISNIETSLEKLCPFGSMIKCFYRVNGIKDKWIVPR